MVLQDNRFLGTNETASVIYHDLFDYPLSANEIIKWRVGKKGLELFKKKKEVLNKDGFYFLRGKENVLYKKALGKRISHRKIKIARKIASLLSNIPTIGGVFVTGALAMNNAEEKSDIDLMIITKNNRLWFTRLFTYLILKITNKAIRIPGDKNQKDKLCLNIWLDETALSWDKNDRNIYSAHEIAQIVPIVSKENIYQRFLQKNRWISDYWPNSVHVGSTDKNRHIKTDSLFVKMVERLAFELQYLYMKPKITRERVGLHKAVFHPRDWGKEINELLST